MRIFSYYVAFGAIVCHFPLLSYFPFKVLFTISPKRSHILVASEESCFKVLLYVRLDSDLDHFGGDLVEVRLIFRKCFVAKCCEDMRIYFLVIVIFSVRTKT